jgi:fused signal recognition particle receptor
MGKAWGPAGPGGSGTLWQRLARAFSRRDPGVRAEAERILLEADFGVAATEEILTQVERVPDGDFQRALEQAVTRVLAAAAPPGDALARASPPPTVILVYGVNGVGKTTTIAKLARRLERDRPSRSVLLAAADTFRAGAGEQLKIWATRLGVPCVGGAGDPAAVVFDAIAAARARGLDTVLVDTAGRLHTEARLLEELKKIVRVVAKQQAGAPHESLLVLDGTVGQNAVHQALAFASAVPLTGLIVTKLDGTAKGGSVVALERALAGRAEGAGGAVPIRFIGVGEGLDDLEAFDPARFAKRLVGE